MNPGADVIKSALKAAREAVKNADGRNRVRLPCILPVPRKIGGILPILLCCLLDWVLPAGGAAGVARLNISLKTVVLGR